MTNPLTCTLHNTTYAMNPQTAFGHTSCTIISSGLRRSQVTSHCHQRVVLILDCSGSMKENNKARDASAATAGLCQELALPVNKAGFEVAVIHFSNRAQLIHPFEPAPALVSHLQPLRIGFFGGETNLTAGLELARELLETAAASPAPAALRYVKPLAVVMSDGMHNHGPGPGPAAGKLKEIADVLAVAFGDDADQAMLEAIATEQLSVRCRSGADLRCYFAQIGRTLTVTRAAGTSATAALANPQS
jgi:Mg-chelatase subunit ChlD